MKTYLTISRYVWRGEECSDCIIVDPKNNNIYIEHDSAEDEIISKEEAREILEFHRANYENIINSIDKMLCVLEKIENPNSAM